MASTRLLFLCAALVAFVALVHGGAVIDPDFECPRNGQFMHPDCWRWYNCGDGIAYVSECQAPLMFDPEFVWCGHPETVDCGDRGTDRPDESAESL